MPSTDDTVEVRRETLQVLVESLEDAWWMRAAEALHELRLVLLQDPVEQPVTFGQP